MPESTLIKLLRVVMPAYQMTPEDEQRLWRGILDQRIQAWQQEIETEARKLGYQGVVLGPRGNDLAELERMSKEDAASVVRTYNRDLESALRRLYAENPDGRRDYYISQIEQWHTDRAGWKDRQIALYNSKTAQYLAQQRFVEMNLSGGRATYYFSGPAPICDDCSDQFAAGVVDQEYVDDNPTPLHPNCPHRWKIAGMGVAYPTQVWTG
jgi:hypothetical protein